MRGEWAVMRAMTIAALAFSIALPVVAHSQRAASPATGCVDPFPYEPRQFLEKLLVVADEVDPYAVPAKFQQVFAMKLRVKAREADPQFPIYTVTECEWYTRVLIASVVDRRLSPKSRVVLLIGNVPQELTFRDSRRGECLSSEIADKSLVASGWSGGIVRSEKITWIYRKGRAELSFAANGIKPGGIVACVSVINIRYQ